MNSQFCECPSSGDLDRLECANCGKPRNQFQETLTGNKLRFKYCPTCGSELQTDSIFCGKCGLQIKAEAETALPASYIESNQDNKTETDRAGSNTKTYLAFGSLIAILLLLVTFTGFGHESSSSNEISTYSGEIVPSEIVPKIENALGIKFYEDRLGASGDSTIKKWFGSSLNGKGISLVFFSNNDALNKSHYLESLFKNSATWYTCDTLAFFGKRASDVDKVYEVLIKSHPDCKIEDSSSQPNEMPDNQESDTNSRLLEGWITNIEPVVCFPREDGADTKLCDLRFTLENNTTETKYADGWVWAKLSNGDFIKQEEGSFSRYYFVGAGDKYSGRIFFRFPVDVVVIEIYKSYLKNSEKYWSMPVNTRITGS